MKNAVIYLGIMAILCAGNLHAGTGMFALNIPAGAMQSALGGQGTALYDDSFAFLYNPACLGLMKNSAGINYKSWFGDVNVMQAAGNYTIDSIGGLGLGFTYSGMTFIEYNETGEKAGELSPRDIIFNMSYARGLGNNLFAGAGLVILNNTLDDNQGASAIALNAGALYQLAIDSIGLDTGLAVKNIGTSAKYEDQEVSLPMHITAGITGNLPWYNIIIPIETGIKGDEFSFTLGLGAGYELEGTGEINGYLGFPVLDDARQMGLGLGLGYNIPGGRTIRVVFSYELSKIENIANISMAINY